MRNVILMGAILNLIPGFVYGMEEMKVPQGLKMIKDGAMQIKRDVEERKEEMSNELMKEECCCPNKRCADCCATYEAICCCGFTENSLHHLKDNGCCVVASIFLPPVLCFPFCGPWAMGLSLCPPCWLNLGIISGAFIKEFRQKKGEFRQKKKRE